MKRLVVLMILMTLALSAAGCRRGFRSWCRRGAPCAAPACVPYYSAPAVQPTYAVPAYPTTCPTDPCACPPAGTVPGYDPVYSTQPTVVEGTPVYSDGASTTPPRSFEGMLPAGRPVVVSDRKVEPQDARSPASTTTAAKK